MTLVPFHHIDEQVMQWVYQWENIWSSQPPAVSAAHNNPTGHVWSSLPQMVCYCATAWQLPGPGLICCGVKPQLINSKRYNYCHYSPTQWSTCQLIRRKWCHFIRQNDRSKVCHEGRWACVCVFVCCRNQQLCGQMFWNTKEHISWH